MTPRTQPTSLFPDQSLVGKVNAYRCDECKGFITTRDVDAGVTPMFLGCRATEGCQGRSVSSGYPDGPIPDWIPPVEWEWYRPAGHDLTGETDEVRDYVAQGGLLLRPITGPAVTR